MKSLFCIYQFRVSDVLVKLSGAILPLVLFLGCGTMAEVVNSEADIDKEHALLLFSVELEGDPAPMHIQVSQDMILLSEIFSKELIFRERGNVKAGQLSQDKLVGVSVPPGGICVEVTRLGDFWYFAGGRLTCSLEVEPQSVYYLGTVHISYAKERSVVFQPVEVGHEGRGGAE